MEQAVRKVLKINTVPDNPTSFIEKPISSIKSYDCVHGGCSTCSGDGAIDESKKVFRS